MSDPNAPCVTYENDDDVIREIATPVELPVLEKLRAAVTPSIQELLTPEQQKYTELTGDLRLLRFLRGYKNDVPAATAAYIKTLNWYKKNNIGKIRQEIVDRQLTLETLPHTETIHKQYLANVWHKADKEGSLLNYELTGRIMPKEFLKVISHEMYMEWQSYHMEFKMLKLHQASHERKRLVRAVIVKDLEGLGMHHAYQPILALLKDALQMATDNYPEMLERAVLVNAPFVFNALWAIVKPWLQQQTLDKVAIFGRTGYHDKFRSWFHVQDLPVSLGGLCSCPGGCVKNVPGTDFMVDGLQIVEIANGAKYELPVTVPAGATLSWEFNVRAHDIKFSVLFAPAGGAAKVAVAESTVVTGKNVTGSLPITADGIATLVWDNTYSFLRNKNVAYKVDLTAPPTPSTDHLVQTPAESESGTLEAAQAALLKETEQALATTNLSA